MARCAVQYGQGKSNVRFVVFDAPRASGNWLERVEYAWQLVSIGIHVWGVKPLAPCQGRQIVGDGGEGVVLCNPAVTKHEVGRTANAVRVKSEFLRALRQRKLVDGRAKD